MSVRNVSQGEEVIVNGVKDHYPLHVILVKATGRVESSNCGCKAGLPEVPSHVGELLFKMIDSHSMYIIPLSVEETESLEKQTQLKAASRYCHYQP